MSHETTMTRDSIVAWSINPVAAEVDREVVLMNLARGRCYGLGETGSEVWRRLASPVRISDLCAELMREYDADAEVVAQDVIALLEQMRDEGLVRVLS